MTKKDLNKWIMYHEIHKLNRLSFSNARIARYLVMDCRTVRKYLSMTEEEYEQYSVPHS
jgi:transposase